MADKTIGELTAGATLTGAELIEIEQGGNSRRTTAQALADLAAVASVAGLTGIVAASALRTALNVEDGATADQTAQEIAALIDADTVAEAALTTALGLGTAAYTAATAYATAAQGATADSAVQPARTLTAGTGLTGGGDLSADRTLALSSGSIASLALADSALQWQAIVARTGTTETANGVAAGSLITMSNAGANTLTVNTGLLSAGQSISVLQLGAGATTIAAGASVTVAVRASKTLVLDGQYAVATLLCIGTDSYVLVGELVAA